MPKFSSRNVPQSPSGVTFHGELSLPAFGLRIPGEGSCEQEVRRRCALEALRRLQSPDFGFLGEEAKSIILPVERQLAAQKKGADPIPDFQNCVWRLIGPNYKGGANEEDSKPGRNYRGVCSMPALGIVETAFASSLKEAEQLSAQKALQSLKDPKHRLPCDLAKEAPSPSAARLAPNDNDNARAAAASDAPSCAASVPASSPNPVSHGPSTKAAPQTAPCAGRPLNPRDALQAFTSRVGLRAPKYGSAPKSSADPGAPALACCLLGYVKLFAVARGKTEDEAKNRCAETLLSALEKLESRIAPESLSDRVAKIADELNPSGLERLFCWGSKILLDMALLLSDDEMNRVDSAPFSFVFDENKPLGKQRGNGSLALAAFNPQTMLQGRTLKLSGSAAAKAQGNASEECFLAGCYNPKFAVAGFACGKDATEAKERCAQRLLLELSKSGSSPASGNGQARTAGGEATRDDVGRCDASSPAPNSSFPSSRQSAGEAAQSKGSAKATDPANPRQNPVSAGTPGLARKSVESVPAPALGKIKAPSAGSGPSVSLLPSDRLEMIERVIGYCFKKKDILRQALTPRGKGPKNYEKMEFCGDAILGYGVTELLRSAYPQRNEGQWHEARCFLVCNDSLADLAALLGFDRALGTRDRGMLADCVESVIDAVQQDSGSRDEAFVLIERLFGGMIKRLPEEVFIRQPKPSLKELVDSWGGSLPRGGCGASSSLGNALNQPLSSPLPKPLPPSGLPEKKWLVGEKILADNPKSRLHALLRANGFPLPEYSCEPNGGVSSKQSFFVSCSIPALGLKEFGEGPNEKIAGICAAEKVWARVSNNLSFPLPKPLPPSGLPKKKWLVGEKILADNPKSRLHALLRANGFPLPEYSCEPNGGVSSKQSFFVSCSIPALGLKEFGKGPNEKIAGICAAEKVWARVSNKRIQRVLERKKAGAPAGAPRANCSAAKPETQLSGSRQNEVKTPVSPASLGKRMGNGSEVLVAQKGDAQDGKEETSMVSPQTEPHASKTPPCGLTKSVWDNPTSRLHALLRANGVNLPEYRRESVLGVPPNQWVVVICSIPAWDMKTFGVGSNETLAGIAAAEEALARIPESSGRLLLE